MSRPARPSLFGDPDSPAERAPPRPHLERPSPYRPPSPAELAARVLADRQAQLDRDCERRGWARVDAADPVACAAHRERWMACDREAAAAFRAAHPWREA